MGGWPVLLAGRARWFDLVGRADWVAVQSGQGVVKEQVVEGAGQSVKRPLNCGQGKGRVGCWAVNRARREGEAAREGEEAQVRGCLLAAPHLAGRPAHGLPATGEVGAVLHLAGRPEERNAGSQAPTQSF